MQSKKFKDTRTGEIVTEFNILDIEHFEEIPEPIKNVKELNHLPADKQAEIIANQILNG